MADSFAAPPVNPLVSITPLTTPAAGREATTIPPQLANLSPGTTLEGFVVNRDGQNNPVVRTPIGDILVKSDVFLKTGSEILFRVDPSQPGAARIVTVDGLPPQDYASNTAPRGLQADTVQQPTLPTATNAALPARGAAAPVPTLPAVLVSTAPPSPALIASFPLLAQQAAAPANLAKLPQGAPLRVAILQASLPATVSASTPVNPAPALPPAPLAATSLPTNVSFATAATPLATIPSPSEPPPAPIATPNAAIAQPGIAQTHGAPLALTQPTTPAAVAQPAATPSLTAANVTAAAPATVLPTSPPPATVTAAHMPPLPIALPANVAALPSPAQAAAQRAYGGNRAPPFTPAPLPATIATQATPQNSVPTPNTTAPTIPGVVIGHEKDGATIVQTALGTLKWHAPQKLPLQTTLQLQLEPTALTPFTVTPASSGTTEAATSLAQHWPALDEAWAAARQDPMLARELAQTLPTVGPRLMSGLLFFMSAVKAGDLRQWLGNRTVAALETKLPDLAARLKGDISQLQQLWNDSPIPQWHSMMVPLMHEGALEQARLFFRHDQEHGETADKTSAAKEQRFIVEVDLHPMGEMQFDGFVRAGERGKQFDLIVRSQAALAPALNERIRHAFDSAMEASMMRGYLGFQHGQQHFVRPLAEKPEGNDAGDAQPILA